MFEYSSFKDCFVEKHGEGKYVRYTISSKSEGAITNINITGYGDSETEVAVKDYAENTGMMDWLIKNGLCLEITRMVSSGFVEYPIVRLDVDKLLSM